jgi:hypothetical protein
MRSSDSSGIALATLLLFVAGVVVGPPRSSEHRPAAVARPAIAAAASRPPSHLGPVAWE